MTRPIYEPTAQRQIRKQGFSADQLFRRPSPVSPDEAASEGCLPPPGALVLPIVLGGTSLSTGTLSTIRYPGGVIAAPLRAYVGNPGPTDAFNTSSSPTARAISYEAVPATDYDDASSDFLSFSPVDDFDVEAGALYGIWFSFKYTDKVGDLHIESRSNNTATDSQTIYGSSGDGRHPNSGTTPSTYAWADATDQTAEYPALGYYGMFPVGGQNDYNDWPFQVGGGQYGMSFQAGETITVKAWTDSDTVDVWLDHLVFMPTFPLGVTDPSNLTNQSRNFFSSALEVFGYYENPQPGSVTEPTDYGSIFGGASAVDDTQELDRFWDASGHFTIASHDESDVSGLYVHAGGGGAHMYVLQRSNNSGGTYDPSNRGRGHVTVFTGSSPLSDIVCQGAGAWTWAYGGIMPLGDGPQGEAGLMQWVGSDVVFWNNYDPAIDSVRSAFIAYLPQAPCEKGVP